MRLAGLRVTIYPNDHRPAHAHVIFGGHEAIFELNCPSGSVSLRQNFGFALHDVIPIQKALAEQLQQLCQAWEAIHGDSK